MGNHQIDTYALPVIIVSRCGGALPPWFYMRFLRHISFLFGCTLRPVIPTFRALYNFFL